jgi:hypothetical protein
MLKTAAHSVLLQCRRAPDFGHAANKSPKGSLKILMVLH